MRSSSVIVSIVPYIHFPLKNQRTYAVNIGQYLPFSSKKAPDCPQSSRKLFGGNTHGSDHRLDRSAFVGIAEKVLGKKKFPDLEISVNDSSD